MDHITTAWVEVCTYHGTSLDGITTAWALRGVYMSNR